MVSTMIQKSGRQTASLDIGYWEPDAQHPNRSNHFDIMTTSGFLLLGFILIAIDDAI